MPKTKIPRTDWTKAENLTDPAVYRRWLDRLRNRPLRVALKVKLFATSMAGLLRCPCHRLLSPTEFSDLKRNLRAAGLEPPDWWVQRSHETRKTPRPFFPVFVLEHYGHPIPAGLWRDYPEREERRRAEWLAGATQPQLIAGD